MAVEQVITKALAKVPADRFASALDFKRALSQALLRPDAAKSKRRPLLVAHNISGGIRGGGIRGASRSLVRSSTSRTEAAPLVRSLAVSPLLNLTGDSTQVYLAEGAASRTSC